MKNFTTDINRPKEPLKVELLERDDRILLEIGGMAVLRILDTGAIERARYADNGRLKDAGLKFDSEGRVIIA